MTSWLPLYLLLLLAATLSPLLTVCGALRITTVPELYDVLGNLVLFAPLGLALRRRSYPVVLVVALVLSVGIEFLQIFLPSER